MPVLLSQLLLLVLLVQRVPVLLGLVLLLTEGSF